MQRESVELPVAVKLPHLLRVAGYPLGQLRALQRRREVEFVQAVHLRDMRHRGAAVRGKSTSYRTRFIRLRDAHGIRCHVGDDAPLPFIRGFAWRKNLHVEMSNAAVRAKRDLGMPYPYT